jgi:phosphoserine aminotransferase
LLILNIPLLRFLPRNAPNKIYNVPVLMSVWIGAMNTEWMIERGGVEAFQELAITRSRLLYAASGIYRGRIWGWRILEICVFLV